jgi:hypothetical protein
MSEVVLETVVTVVLEVGENSVVVFSTLVVLSTMGACFRYSRNIL